MPYARPKRQPVASRPTIPVSPYELGLIRSAYGHRDRRDSRGSGGNLFGDRASSVRSLGDWLRLKSLRAITRRVRQRSLVIFKPKPIPHVDIAAAERAFPEVLGLAQSRSADVLAEYCPARPRLVHCHDRGHVHLSKKIGPGFPRPIPIRRAAYIRPRCHRGFILCARSALSNRR
jgi:hypothetical protein